MSDTKSDKEKLEDMTRERDEYRAKYRRLAALGLHWVEVAANDGKKYSSSAVLAACSAFHTEIEAYGNEKNSVTEVGRAPSSLPA